MNDYVALAREALDNEGIEAYFGRRGVEVLESGDASLDTFVGMLAEELDERRVTVADDEAWTAPDGLTERLSERL